MNRTVTSAQYIKDGITNTKCSIKAVIEGETMYVPINSADNTERMLIQAWEDAGNTIAEAD
jgi:hypothetical protein